MRILLLSQYFAPEVTAARFRLQPLAERLAANGHEVEVVCEVPNHPEGVVHDGYRRLPWQRRRLDGYTARYVWVCASPRKTQRRRLLFYGSYALMAALAGASSRRPDVVLASSPPLPVAAAAMAVARLRRVPWVLDVRDPWPEAPVALGELTDERAIRALQRLERRLYASASAIVTVTEPFREGIVAKLGDPEKVSVVPNGTTESWLAAGERQEDRAELAMPADRFVLSFAGNVGLAQGMDSVVEAAGRLDDGFQLQIVGSGPRLESVREGAAALPKGRVALRGLVAPELAARYLRASDACLVPLGAVAERQRSIPLKLYDSCAVGRPVILAAAGEAARIAAAEGAALCIAPDDPDALVAAVRRLREDGELRERLGRGGRDFARRHRREAALDRFERILADAAAPDSIPRRAGRTS